MPHIVAKDFGGFKRDFVYGKSRFLFITEPFKKEEIIGVLRDNREFLLRVSHTPKGILIKQDKRMRVPSAGIIKESLKELALGLGLELSFDNLGTITPKQRAISNLIEPQDAIKLIKENKKVSLEIGFGSGRHILKNARENPDTTYIGIEIHTPSIMQVLRQIEIQNLSNLFILSLDARVLLEIVPSNSIDELFIHFPVPWDNSPSKRVLTKESVSNIGRALKKGGLLHLRTDSKSFYHYSKELLLSSNLFTTQFYKNRELDVISKYEQRWKNRSKDIYDIYAYSREESSELERVRPLSLGDIDIKRAKPFVKKEGELFVALKNIYTLKEGGELLFITGGSIHSPIKYFLLKDKKEVRFFGPKPLPSHASIASFEILKEVLC